MIKYRRLIVTILIASLILVSGCGGVKAKDLDLVSEMTRQELIDFYKEDMNYTASYEARTSKVYREIINKSEITDKTKRLKLIRGQELIEGELCLGAHNNGMAVSKNQFEYIKSILDDKVLTKDKVDKVEGGSGYCFVDVKYKAKPKQTGQIGDMAKYLGIHGIFTEGINGGIELNQYYVNILNQRMQYIGDIKAASTAGQNKFNAQINVNPLADVVKEQEKEIKEQNNNDNEGENKMAESTQDDSKSMVENSQVYSESEDKNKVIENKGARINVRKPSINCKYANEIAGSSIQQTAIMPELISIYQPAITEGLISGYGIFPQGGFYFDTFNFDRGKLNWDITLRYVFKEDIKNNQDIKFIAIYPVNIKVNNKLRDVKKDIIADFIKVEIEKSIDRVDRAIMNNDLAALMSGELFEDAGAAILYGNKNKNNYVITNCTKVSDVICKKGNSYLVELEQYVQDGIKNSDVVVKYNNKYYAIINQYDTRFIVGDYVCVESRLLEEPNLGNDSSYVKRLVALSSGGDVSEKNKKEIEKLMESLYEASTNRELKGIYSCFNDDTELLSEENKEYINSRLRGLLIKEGTKTKSIYSGKITRWLSGADRQAEFITDEVIQYDGKKSITKMETYYLVSCYKDKWVIDDIKILESSYDE